MKKISCMLLLSFIFFLSFTSAAKITQIESTGLTIDYPKFDNVQIGEAFEFNIHVFNSSNGLPVDNTSVQCWLHGYYRNGTHLLMVPLSFEAPFDFTYTVPGQYFTGGKGAYIVQCNNSEGGFASANFDVTITGFDAPTSFDGRTILLLFFGGLILLLFHIQRNIDFDRWYNKILSKYNKKNFFKTFIASIGYYFMNNPFSLFYMIGLFIVMVLYDIVRVYNLQSIYGVAQVFVAIYLVGLILIGLEVFGEIQQMFSKIVDDLKRTKWGLDHGEKS